MRELCWCATRTRSPGATPSRLLREGRHRTFALFVPALAADDEHNDCQHYVPDGRRRCHVTDYANLSFRLVKARVLRNEEGGGPLTDEQRADLVSAAAEGRRKRRLR